MYEYIEVHYLVYKIQWIKMHGETVKKYMFLFKLMKISATDILFVTVVVGTKLRLFPTPLCSEQRKHKACTMQSKIITHTEMKWEA